MSATLVRPDGSGQDVLSQRKGRRTRRAFVVVVCLVAALAHLALQTSMLLVRPDFSWSRFRGYFPFDQTSYLSIVVNGARGDFALTEPFTGTGVNYYPHAYYLLLGLIGRLTGLAPVVAWQVGGLAAQALLVVLLAFANIAFSGRVWTGLLAPVPFVVGTFSSLTGPLWYTTLHQHAVLWGAYGVLFTLNGESVSLCLGGLALLALLAIADGRLAGRGRLPMALLACFVLGALSAVQTYSFIVAVYLAAFVAAALALMRSRPSVGVPLGVLSLALLGAMPLIGPTFADSAGPLATLVLGMAPAAPGLLVLLGQVRGPLVACATATAVGAAPQVAWTVRGVATGDPFLLYRQASTAETSLGVGVAPAFIAAAVPLGALVLLLLAGILGRRQLWVAVPAGAIPAWALVAANDRWGAQQEPYRLWIDAFTLVVVVCLPLLVQAGVAVCASGSNLAGRWAGSLAVVAVAASVAATLGDYGGFWRYGHSQISMIDYQTSQGDAVAAVAGPSSPLAHAAGLRLPDPCLDPFMVKVRDQLPVAFYNYGMAWPDHEQAMGRLMAARTAGQFDAGDAWTAGVRIVLTDSRCSADWPKAAADALQPLATHDYIASDGSAARIEAWRLTQP